MFFPDIVQQIVDNLTYTNRKKLDVNDGEYIITIKNKYVSITYANCILFTHNNNDIIIYTPNLYLYCDKHKGILQTEKTYYHNVYNVEYNDYLYSSNGNYYVYYNNNKIYKYNFYNHSHIFYDKYRILMHGLYTDEYELLYSKDLYSYSNSYCNLLCTMYKKKIYNFILCSNYIITNVQYFVKLSLKDTYIKIKYKIIDLHSVVVHNIKLYKNNNMYSGNLGEHIKLFTSNMSSLLHYVNNHLTNHVQIL